MLIKDFYKKDKRVVSFEVFPPRKEAGIQKLYETIEDLKDINPDYVSVTYGAGGSTKDKSVEIASTIQNKIGIETMAHLTCVNSTKEDIGEILKQFKEKNIDNILALRGDPPSGQENFTKTIGGFGYANELVEYIKDNGEWSVAVAGYPEGHIEAKDLHTDIDNLKKKVDGGADLIILQLFFDNRDFREFRELAAKKNIDIPIVPGIFPILNFSAITKISELCGAKIPKELYERLERCKDDSAEVEKIGIEFAIKQLDGLLDDGIEGVHFYTMNKSRQIKDIYRALESKIRAKIG